MTSHPQNTPIFANSAPFEATRLPQWGLIIVEGPDAASFLQNQLSNSVLGLTPTPLSSIAKTHAAVRLVGYCNPKGRLLASAWLGLFPSADGNIDRFALYISRDIAAFTAKRLAMYILRSKLTVRDVSEEWQIVGLYGTGKCIGESIEPSSFALQLPDVLVDGNSYERIVYAEPITSPNPRLMDKQILLNWNYLEVVSAIPRIVQSTQEQFVPQMINFESVAGVDFKKGCYPGQEIVARSQYRGTVKRRLQLAHAFISSGDLSTDYGPGTEVFHSENLSQPAGMIVLSEVHPTVSERMDFQVECKLESLEAGILHIGSPGGPTLIIDSLPYGLLEI